MEPNFAPLLASSYLQQIAEITTQSEAKHIQIKSGEKEVCQLKLKIEELTKEKCELQTANTNKISELGKQKIVLLKTTEENKCLKVLEKELVVSLNNEDKNLWDLKESVYSELIAYCDKVQEFVENYNFQDVINSYLYPSRENTVSLKSKRIPETNAKKVEHLKQTKDKLGAELTELNKKQIFVKNLLESKVHLKHEPMKGQQFLELQNEITNSKELAKKLSFEVFALENKRNENKFGKEDLVRSINCDGLAVNKNSSYGKEMYDSSSHHVMVNNDSDSRQTLYEGELYATSSTNNSTANPNPNSHYFDKSKSKAVNFVPKTGKRFRPSSRMQ